MQRETAFVDGVDVLTQEKEADVNQMFEALGLQEPPYEPLVLEGKTQTPRAPREHVPPAPLTPHYPCVVCTSTDRWPDRGIWRCRQCWPPGSLAKQTTPHTLGTAETPEDASQTPSNGPPPP